MFRIYFKVIFHRSIILILEILLWMIFGICCGIITGLIPGIHINMVATTIFLFIIQGTFQIDTVFLAVFIVSVGITHTFIDFIPSLFLGVPSEDTVVSMLPGHQLVNQGRGFEALHLCAFGSFGGVFLLIGIFIFAYYILLPLYEVIFEQIGKLLLGVMIYLIIKEETKNSIFWAIIIVMLSGGFGLIVLNSIHISNPLFLIFTGMFGTATLIISLLDITEIRKQEILTHFNIEKQYYLGLLVGGISAMICSISPGLGNAQAGTLAMNFLRKVNSEMMIVILSAINTINFGLSLLTLYVLDKARNGAVLILKDLDIEFTFQLLLLLVFVMICVATISYHLVFILGRGMIYLTEKIPLFILNLIIIVGLTFFIIYMSNISEFFVYVASICLGILCVQVQVRRVHLMSVLLVPIIIALW